MQIGTLRQVRCLLMLIVCSGSAASADAERRVIPGSYIISTKSPDARIPHGSLAVRYLGSDTPVRHALVASEYSADETLYRRGTDLCNNLLIRPNRFQHRHGKRLKLRPSKFQRVVQHCEADAIGSLIVTPNDMNKFYPGLWGLKKIQMESGWDITTGHESVVVGVVDTGIDYTHPDLGSNIWSNTGEIAGNGVDDDGNGYVDDTRGWNATAENTPSDPMDTHNHGTHCAGTIGALGNNNRGVAGINWNVKLMPLKSFNSNGSGALSDVIEALNYALTMKHRGVNIRVLSNSYGGFPNSVTLSNTITALENAGILFVAGAGNATNDNDASPFYPASFTHNSVVSVAATDKVDAKASFSNYGASSVDVGAPGVEIWSTVRTSSNGGYGLFNGTSMATPHVAGVAALIAGAYPALTAAQLKSVILNSGDPVSALQGKTVTGRRINALAALQAAAGLAAPPTPMPSPSPTSAPTFAPTAAPTAAPSSAPTAAPTPPSTPPPSAAPSPTPSFTQQPVTGTVLTTFGTAAWGNTRVRVSDDSGNVIALISVHRATGNFAKALKLRSGKQYTVAVDPPANYSATGADARTITANGSAQPLNVLLAPTQHTVSGMVSEKVNRKGVPVAGATVTVVHAVSGTVLGTAVTGVDGQYRVGQLPYGERIDIRAQISNRMQQAPTRRITLDYVKHFYFK